MNPWNPSMTAWLAHYADRAGGTLALGDPALWSAFRDAWQGHVGTGDTPYATLYDQVRHGVQRLVFLGAEDTARGRVFRRPLRLPDLWVGFDEERGPVWHGVLAITYGEGLVPTQLWTGAYPKDWSAHPDPDVLTPRLLRAWPLVLRDDRAWVDPRRSQALNTWDAPLPVVSLGAAPRPVIAWWAAPGMQISTDDAPSLRIVTPQALPVAGASLSVTCPVCQTVVPVEDLCAHRWVCHKPGPTAAHLWTPTTPCGDARCVTQQACRWADAILPDPAG